MQPAADTCYSVVVCDDRRELRDAVRTLLTGHREFRIIDEAWDAESCLTSVRRSPPDVLILDVNLPGGGVEIAREVKSVNPAVHILAFTASTDPLTRQRMLEAGADDYVVKTGRIKPLLDGLDRSVQRIGRR